MPKFQGIEYQFEGLTIKFVYEGEDVILPIRMGQSAYHVMSAHFDKIQRKTTTTAQTRESYPGSHKVLRALEDVLIAVAEDYVLKKSHLTLITSALKLNTHKPLKDDVELLIQRLVPQYFTTLLERDKTLSMIATVYETHKKYRRIQEPKSVIVAAKPMSEWYLPSRHASIIIKN